MLDRSCVRLVLLLTITSLAIQARTAAAADDAQPANPGAATDPAQAELQARINHAQEELDALPRDAPERPAAAAEVLRLKKLLRKADPPTAVHKPQPQTAPHQAATQPAKHAGATTSAESGKKTDAPEDFNTVVLHELKRKLAEHYFQEQLLIDKAVAAVDKARASLPAAQRNAPPRPEDPVVALRERSKDLKRLQAEVTDDLAARIIAEQNLTFDAKYLEGLRAERAKRVANLNLQIRDMDEKIKLERSELVRKTLFERRLVPVKERADLLRANDATGAGDAIFESLIFRPDDRVYLRSDPNFMAKEKPATAPATTSAPSAP